MMNLYVQSVQEIYQETHKKLLLLKEEYTQAMFKIIPDNSLIMMNNSYYLVVAKIVVLNQYQGFPVLGLTCLAFTKKKTVKKHNQWQSFFYDPQIAIVEDNFNYQLSETEKETAQRIMDRYFNYERRGVKIPEIPYVFDFSKNKIDNLKITN